MIDDEVDSDRHAMDYMELEEEEEEEHGRIWSPFHPFLGRGWRRSQNGVGHKMRREKKQKNRMK